MLLRILLLTLFLAPLARSAPLPAVRDLFLDMPSEHLTIVSTKSGKPLSRAERSRLIHLDDVKNAYLEVKGTADTDIFGGGEMTLFRTKSGSFLIAWHVDSNGDGTENIQFFTKEGPTWTDVTKKVLPTLTAEQVDQRAQKLIPAFAKSHRKLSDGASGTYAYKLPRHGTTIEVYVASNAYSGPHVTLWHLKFDGEQFHLAD